MSLSFLSVDSNGSFCDIIIFVSVDRTDLVCALVVLYVGPTRAPVLFCSLIQRTYLRSVSSLFCSFIKRIYLSADERERRDGHEEGGVEGRADPGRAVRREPLADPQELRRGRAGEFFSFVGFSCF